MGLDSIVKEHPFYHGEGLKNAIETANEERKPLIESFIAKDSLNLWYAKDGIGKSVLALQVCLEASSGQLIFGSFKPENPLKILYLIAERHPSEVFERARRMKGKIEANYENLLFDTSLQGLDLQSERHRMIALDRIGYLASKMNGIDLFIVDPMYALTSGRMTGDEGASHITDFSRKVQTKFGCSNIFLHHPNRGVRSKEGGEREGEDLYGSRFISAHFTCIYHIRQTGRGTKWTAEKDSYHFQQRSIDLTYETETDTSFIQEGRPPQIEDKLDEFLKVKLRENKPFTFNEFVSYSQVSLSWGRKTIKRHLENGSLEVCKSSNRESLYFARSLESGGVS